MSDKDLSYSGPIKEYAPQIGSNFGNPPSSDLTGRKAYVSLDNLKSDLSHILNRCSVIIEKCKNELSIFSIDLGTTEKRKQSANAVFSDFETTSSDLISYNQILEIEKLANSNARFIVDEFKKELRKPNGSSAQEIKKITDIIYNETLRINNLVGASFFGSNSSAETTLIEVFMELTSIMKDHVYRLDSFFVLPRGERNKLLPKEEIDILTESEAKQYQSVFQLSINGLNDEMDKDIDYMTKFFSNSSDFFYRKIVSPLTEVQVKTSNLRTSSPINENLAAWLQNVKESFDRNFLTALYDILDRTNKFDEYLSRLEQKISLRENYLSYIRQLSQKGKTPISSLLENAEKSNFSIKEQKDSLINDHSSISGRESNAAHEQYLLKYNDYLRGDLNFLEYIKIDGVDLSAHEHDGLDGSSLIDGSVFEDDSIGSNLISKEYKNKPVNLKLIQFSGDQMEIMAKLFWLTEDKNVVNEIQVSKINVLDFTDPGKEEPETPVPRVPGYIPPFESYDPLYIEWITEIDYELFFN